MKNVKFLKKVATIKKAKIRKQQISNRKCFNENDKIYLFCQD